MARKRASAGVGRAVCYVMLTTCVLLIQTVASSANAQDFDGSRLQCGGYAVELGLSETSQVSANEMRQRAADDLRDALLTTTLFCTPAPAPAAVPSTCSAACSELTQVAEAGPRDIAGLNYLRSTSKGATLDSKEAKRLDVAQKQIEGAQWQELDWLYSSDQLNVKLENAGKKIIDVCLSNHKRSDGRSLAEEVRIIERDEEVRIIGRDEEVLINGHIEKLPRIPKLPARSDFDGRQSMVYNTLLGQKELFIEREKECSSAEWVVSAGGTVKFNDPKKEKANGTHKRKIAENTVCVEAAGSPSARFRIEFAFDGERRVLEGWPGIPIELPQGAWAERWKEDAQKNIVSLKVFARPDARALEVFAITDAAGLAGHGVTDLLERLRLVANEGQKSHKATADLKAWKDTKTKLNTEISTLRTSSLKPVYEQLVSELGGLHSPDNNLKAQVLSTLVAMKAWRDALAGPLTGWHGQNGKFAPDVVGKFLGAIPQIVYTDDRVFQIANELLAFKNDPEATALEKVLPPEALKAEVEIKPADASKLYERLCGIARRRVLFVSQEIVPQNAEIIIDYDFAGGLIGTKVHRPADDVEEQNKHRYDDEDEFFVRVHQVPPGGGVTVQIDGKTVGQSSRGREILGVPTLDSQLSLTATKSSPSQGSSALPSAQLPPGSAGTLVLRVRPLPPGRQYILTVCSSKDGSPATCGGSTKKEGDAAAVRNGSLGEHKIEIHGKFYLGLRIGLGGGVTLANDRTLAYESGSGDSTVWQVRKQTVQPYFSVPLLLTWYPCGRDPLRYLPAFGIGLGLDLARPDRLLAGLSADFGGFGITAWSSIEQIDRSDAPIGRTIVGESPDIEELFGTTERWAPGFGVSMTLDADIFRVLFGKALQAKVPTL